MVRKQNGRRESVHLCDKRQLAYICEGNDTAQSIFEDLSRRITIAEDLHEWTSRGGHELPGMRLSWWERQKEDTVEKRGRIYGGKSRSGACNYRSDRYANG